MINRQDYVAGKYTHRQYYAQFTSAGTVKRVLESIGVERLLASTDKHLNDIPLKEWDRLGESEKNNNLLLYNMELCNDYLTQAGLVCILKEAAKQIIDHKKGQNNES